MNARMNILKSSQRWFWWLLRRKIWKSYFSWSLLLSRTMNIMLYSKAFDRKAFGRRYIMFCINWKFFDWFVGYDVRWEIARRWSLYISRVLMQRCQELRMEIRNSWVGASLARFLGPEHVQLWYSWVVSGHGFEYPLRQNATYSYMYRLSMVWR